MADNPAFEYIRLIPVLLVCIAVWIVIGSIGERIARRHATTRSREKCPQCEGTLKGARRDVQDHVLGKVFLVDIARYACVQCGFRQSIWKA